MKMQLLDDLINAVKENSAPVSDVRVGVSWTGVHGKYCGVAKTYGIPVKHGNYTRGMGGLTDKTTLELAEYTRSWNLVEASIGVAAINAMIKPQGKEDVNALDRVIEMGKGKKIVMVGMFPMIKEIRAASKELCVLEADPTLINPNEGIITEAAAEYVIPGSDIVIITGSTLINKSMERFLRLAREASAYTIILGPSTPMCEVLFDHGASMLAGIEITKPGGVLNTISQSGGMINSKVCKGEILFKVMER
jgi:uncharacterized protein (DUF4213/DUF364 family)